MQCKLPIPIYRIQTDARLKKKQKVLPTAWQLVPLVKPPHAQRKIFLKIWEIFGKSNCRRNSNY